MNEEQLLHAHQHSKRHRAEIISSRVCGCFYCLRTFPSSSIGSWCDPGKWDNTDPTRPKFIKFDRPQTAVCPCCGIDAVLGDFSGFPITTEFLSEMHDRWFEKTISLEEFKKRLKELAFLREDAP